MSNQIKIKDVILNIIQLKKQRESLKNELLIIETQIEQQSKFIENAIVEEALLSPDPIPPKK